MEMKCTFILSQMDSPSGDFSLWETDGASERVPSPMQYAKEASRTDSYLRITVESGQRLFLCEHDDEGDLQMLVVVPVDHDKFQAFCAEAEKEAGQAVYDRINGYKTAMRGPYVYSNGFGGHWLRKFATSTWNTDSEKRPENLAEALELSS